MDLLTLMGYRYGVIEKVGETNNLSATVIEITPFREVPEANSYMIYRSIPKEHLLEIEYFETNELILEPFIISFINLPEDYL